jgi:hypothetical protein
VVTTVTGMRNYPVDSKYSLTRIPVKKISLPNSGVWKCPEFFRAREVSFLSDAVASLRIKCVGDEDFDTLWLEGGEKYTMEAEEIDIDNSTAKEIVVWAY